MLTEVRAGPYTIRGISVGGIYTALHVRELDVLLDVGLAPRSFAGARAVFLSHGHADHSGALATLLGTRMLTCGNRRLRIFLPAGTAPPIQRVLDAVSDLQRTPVNVELVPMEPGDQVVLHGDVHVRAVRTYHPVPSLAYVFLRRVNKLRREYMGLDGREIRRRRLAGEALFDPVEHLELAYVTDTLPRVLEAEPALFDVKTLILECTFIDERKSAELAHQSCHIHLDDLRPLAERFNNQAVVLMHFSQIYSPHEIAGLLDQRCPRTLRERVVVFAPDSSHWPG
jgi:ribonuclease Z